MIQQWVAVLVARGFTPLAQAEFGAVNIGQRMLTAAFVFAASMGGLAASPHAQAAVLYQIDDGKSEAGVGISDTTCSLETGTAIADFIWLNQFEVREGTNTIDGVSIAWGTPAAIAPCSGQPLPQSGLTEGLAAKVLVYEERGDGTLQLLAQQDTPIANPGTDAFFDVRFDTPARLQGKTFYVGALLPNQLQNQFPAALDSRDRSGQPNSRNQSYLAFNPFFPQRADYDYSVITPTLYSDGNFLIRASGQRVPEPSVAIALLTIAAGAVILKKRQ
ncbi:PEP-CTERM sorting domain-containing protein [Myxacorys almedinensis]|uniref:PEP-CTERM sorting domain-containing protein n=1 Tax=Myxacorys almedinensis A TaxID=2690445 RepID=A0A8J8CHD3_9CYAN|nr:PEP-CTERM sorting domain-containing protein [Myxacorys almedinensis]NDJ16593.1 PEP-CTERM sorting domain-containing protein [Myxacorys almedinensis A]